MIRKSSRRVTLCVVVLCLNIAFIWGNSLLPGEVSGAFSQWVRDLINWILGLPAKDPEQGHGLLRKIAHFTEFACLGVEISCLVRMLRSKKAEHIALPMVGGFFTACIDETIQRFVPDRGPGILDVLIDTAGVFVGTILVCFVIYHRERKMDKKEKIL